jgi:N-methylhydantoinase B
MLDASDLHQHRAMASTQTPGSCAAVSGVDGAGHPFATIFMDELAGGGGAHADCDGADSSGTLTSPGAQTHNIETTEAYFPVLYHLRRELADSGGPGTYRGGVGTINAYAPHRTRGSYTLAPVASGIQHPGAVGIAGGEPGVQGAGLVVPTAIADSTPSWEEVMSQVEVKAPFLGQSLDQEHVFMYSNQGGGGCGDPLERDADQVLEDVLEGLVSEAGARRDYGVVLKPAKPEAVLDEAATRTLREQTRRARLGGKALRARDYERKGRRISRAVEAVGDDVLCTSCGQRLCRAGENLYEHLALREGTPGERFAPGDRYPGSERFCVRHFYCPGCATQIDVHVAVRGEPLLEAISTKPPA